MKRVFRLFLLFVLVLFRQPVYAQEITVIDNVTQERIPGVKVRCSDDSKRKLANSEGRFKLEDFAGCDTIIISYSSYVTGVYSYQELRGKVTVALDEVELDVDGVVVSVNRWEDQVSEIANRVRTISPRDMEIENPQTSADLLASSGYVYVQKSQFAGGSPQMRGYGTNRVMIVVDGVRMNNAIFRSGNLQNVISIDPLALSGVEVLFGPGSVMYGSDAIGGVMDFSTKKLQFAPDSTGNYSKANLFSRYSSASNEITGHADYSFGTEKFASTTSISYSRFGDLVTGKNGDSSLLRPTYQKEDQTVINENPRIQVHSGYDQINLMQKFGFKPKAGVDWSYGINYSTNLQNAPRYDRLTLDLDKDGDLDYEEWYYGPQEWMMQRVSYSNVNATSLYNKIRVIAAYQNFKESRHDRRMGSNRIRRQYENVNAFSINLDLEKEFGNRVKLFYGVESVLNTVNSNAYREFDDGTITEINPRYPDGSIWQSHGVYANAKIQLNEKWIADFGARYALFSANTTFDTTLFAYPIVEASITKGAPSGTASIVFRPSAKTQWYTNISTGFRAPNIDDLGKVFDSEPGIVVVPNPTLQPEFAYSAETGIVKVLGAKFKLDASVYVTYLQNVLVREPFQFNGQDSILYEGQMSQVFAIQNESNAYTYGFQAGFEWSIVKGLKLSSTFSYQKGYQYFADSAAYFPKAQVSPMFGRTSLKYITRQMRLEAYCVYNGEVSHDAFPLEERNELNYALDSNGNPFAAAWYTLNFKASYFFNKHLSTTVGVENITNQLYRTFGSGISAPGRNFIVSVRVAI